MGDRDQDGLERRFTVQEVAKRYGVAVSTVQRWVRTGRLSALRLGGAAGYYWFTREDLEAFEAKGRIGA